MVYSKPHYFLGQQDAGLPLKGRSQSVLGSRRYSGVYPRVSPSPPKPVQKTSTLKSGHQTKPIWVDRKTGRVVKGPDFLKGERLIRFEDSTTTDSDSTETVRCLKPMPRVNIGDRSSRQSPRRTSRSPSRHHSSSPQRRGTSPYWRISPSRDYKYESYARASSPRRYLPRSSSYSSSSTSSFTASVPSSSYFQTEFSESDSSTSSGYDSGAFDWRNYHNAQHLGASSSNAPQSYYCSPRCMTPGGTGRIIMLKPRSGRSPLQNLVSHHHHCEQHHNTCKPEACHHRGDQSKPLGCRQSVSRRSRAASKILPERPSSNLSFFEETILPGPNMPLQPINPLRYDESETYSDSSSSYYGPSRNYIRGASHVRAPARGRLNGNLEKWLNDALKNSYSPPANSSCGVCRGEQMLAQMAAEIFCQFRTISKSFSTPILVFDPTPTVLLMLQFFLRITYLTEIK
ncbi:hypothetical protein TSMEX_010133 [Taenia solium]|eukprot:TsM_000147900 transcript=TsM_000147900 gene=TsM_000147900